MEKDKKKTPGFYEGFTKDVLNYEITPPVRVSAGDSETKELEETTAANKSVQTGGKARPKRKKVSNNKSGVAKSKTKQEDREEKAFKYLVNVESETRQSCSFHIHKEYEKVIKNIAGYGRDPEGKRIKNVGQAIELIVEKFLNSLDEEDRKLFLETEKPLSKFKF